MENTKLSLAVPTLSDRSRNFRKWGHHVKKIEELNIYYISFLKA